MTAPDGAARQEPGHAAVEAATADLDRLRQLLLEASRAERDAAEVRDSLQSYWRTHGTVLKGVAASVGEQVRLQALEQLYKWRTQLAQQLPPHGARTPGRLG